MDHPHIWGLSEWKPLARGGLALVWEARQSLLARLVAVKVYQRELAGGDLGAFAREAGAVGRLSDHHGIVTAYDAGVLPDNRPYLIMELCPGGSLTQWLDPENRPTEEQVRAIGIQVADTLAAVHACGVVHRDVKPANILIDSFGHPRLADFGLAAEIGTQPAAADALRVTPSYAPPEAFGLDPASEAGDVFSLAATLYALLAGRSPRRVDAAAGLDQVLAVATQPIVPLPGVNWFLMDALTTALSNDPAARPTATAFREQLAEVPAARTWRRVTRASVADAAPLAPVTLDAAPTGQEAVSNGHGVAARERAAEERSAEQAGPAGVSRGRRSRRAGVMALAATVLTVAVSGVASWVITGPTNTDAPAAITKVAEPSASAPSVDPSPRAADPRPQPSKSKSNDRKSSAPADKVAIRVQDSDHSAEPFETVRLRGTYSGGAETFVRVQRWEDGTWQTFPVPAKTDPSGAFTAYVELGEPRRYRLRVLDPRSGVASEDIVVVIRR